MSIKNKLLKNTFFSSVHIYTEYILGLACSIIIARSLGPNDYGVYSLFLWLSASSIILINGGLNTGQIKFISEVVETHDISYANSILRYLNKIQILKTILIVFIAVISKSMILDKFDLQEYSSFYWVIIAALIVRGRYMFNVSTLKGFQKFDKLAKISLIVTPVNLVLIIAAAIFYKNIEFFIYIYLLIGILFYFVSYIYAKVDVPNNETLQDPILLNRINNYLKITSLIVILSYFVSKELEVFMLGWLATPEDAGMFRIAMTISTSILLMVPGVFSSILLPVMSSSLAVSEEVARHRFYESTRILIILCIPIALLVAAISSHLIVFIYGIEYQRASIVLSICILAIALVTISDSAQSYLQSAEKQKLLLFILLIALFVKIAIGYVLISNYGLLGAAITFLVSIVIAYIPRIYFACRYLESAFPFVTLIKSIIISILCIAPIFLMYNFESRIAFLSASTITFTFLFLLLSLVFKLFENQDIDTFNSISNKIPTVFIRKNIKVLLDCYRKR